MPRPPALPADQKAAIVLSILSGETTAAEAARTAGVSGQAIGNWRRRFLEAGRAGLEGATGQQNHREQQLLDEIKLLKSALGDTYLQLQAIRSRTHPRPAGTRAVVSAPKPQTRVVTQSGIARRPG